MKIGYKLCFIIFCAYFSITYIKAQTIDVVVFIQDEQQQVLKGKEVDVYDMEKNFIRTYVSDENGAISFFELKKGKYVIHVPNEKGYKKVEPIEFYTQDNPIEITIILQMENSSIRIQNYSSLNVLFACLNSIAYGMVFLFKEQTILQAFDGILGATISEKSS